MAKETPQWIAEALETAAKQHVQAAFHNYAAKRDTQATKDFRAEVSSAVQAYAEALRLLEELVWQANG